MTEGEGEMREVKQALTFYPQIFSLLLQMSSCPYPSDDNLCLQICKIFQ